MMFGHLCNNFTCSFLFNGTNQNKPKKIEKRKKNCED